jgi:hypothetical protein
MHKMNPADQVVLWTIWDGMTTLAAQHMQYSVFDHAGLSGGSLAPFTPRSESYLMGVRFGWWEPTPGDYVIYTEFTLIFMADQAIQLANETPN